MCSIMDLREGMCRHTEDAKTFCGKPVHKVSYCQEHYNKCYMDKKEAREYKRILESMEWNHWGVDKR